MSSAAADRSKLVVGTAPDSWGVWFDRDDKQVGWQQYLDEVALAGYVWTELGPQGFMPQDPAQLRDELAARKLQVSGGTVFAGLHKGADALTESIAAFSQEARLLSEVGAKYLVHLPEQYTDMYHSHLNSATQVPMNAVLDQLIHDAHVWRWMLAVAAVPAVALLVGMRVKSIASVMRVRAAPQARSCAVTKLSLALP